jgi:hypothetical protein
VVGATPPFPTGVAVDAAGNVVVAPMEDNRIALVDTLGSVIAIAGTGRGAGFGTLAGAGRPALRGEAGCPEDVAVGPDGTISFADLQTQRVRVLTRELFHSLGDAEEVAQVLEDGEKRHALARRDAVSDAHAPPAGAAPLGEPVALVSRAKRRRVRRDPHVDDQGRRRDTDGSRQAHAQRHAATAGRRPHGFRRR